MRGEGARAIGRRSRWLLGGIFVAHYFIEAFVWRFREPFYRATLAPLYFPPSLSSAEREVVAPAPVASA